MCKRLALLLATVSIFSACTSSTESTRQTRQPIIVDEYAVLDDRAAEKPSDLSLQKKLNEARRHYLVAMKASEQGNKALAARHFEAAMTILNTLVTYPDIYENPEFTRLSESLIADYEDQITSIDSLDANSSFFVLRDKIFQEVETIPVERKSYPSKRQIASATASTMSPAELQIELTDNTPVQQCVSFFTSEKGRKFFSKWLARTGRYFPLYEKVFAEEGVPQELRHLSMIESGLSPTAVSWAKAVGLWQFIPSTGVAYGLTINWWVDERRDPEKATRAAARYLKDLYTDLGDWHLALAAYNCGPGRVRSAIRKAGTRDYWAVRQYLPRETQQYVPLYIAATKITMEPEAYGFTSIDYDSPEDFQTIQLKGSFDLSTISQTSKVPVDELKALNPELIRDRTPFAPANSYGYSLRVPVRAPSDLAQLLNTRPVPAESQITWVKHNVKRGESMTGIADKYDVEIDDIYAANEMTSKSTLRNGMTLRIPVESGAPAADTTVIAGSDIAHAEKNPAPVSATIASNDHKPTPPKNTPPPALTVRHTEKVRAETPVVAKSNPTASTEEKKFVAALTGNRNAPEDPAPSRTQAKNGTDAGSKKITSNDQPKSSKKPTVAAEKTTALHTVRKGETLTGIATQYGVRTAELAAWNKLERTAEVRTGQKLQVNGVIAEKSLAANNDKPAKNDKSVKSDKKSKGSDRIASSDVKKNKKRSTTTTSTRFENHKVKKGESLTVIADRYGVSVDDLKAWNGKNLKGTSLQAGASLKIYSESPSKGDARRSSRSSKSTPKSYTVRKGETLDGIAKKYGVSLKALKKNNPKLSEKNLRAGQSIKIGS